MKLKSKIMLIVIFLFFCTSIFFPYNSFINFEDEMFITYDELDDLNYNSVFLTSNIARVSANDDDFDEYVINYKLFNLFNIKKLKVNVIEPDRYFAGGETVGFSLQSKGVILVGGNYILTNNGIEKPFENSGLRSGDILTHINDIEISNVGDIAEILKGYSIGELDLRINRNGEILSKKITPSYDRLTDSYKLGLWIKEDAVGIGTLTFINATTKRFGSLGHSINDSETNECIEVSGGNIYKSKIMGINKGKSGKAGELIGTFNRQNVTGSVDKNCEYGVYGFVDDVEVYTSDKTSVEIGGRLSAKPGKAQIYSCLDGENIETFDIEIIKTNFQSSCNEKSMVIRVIDEELIERTGGIVQGMSGSPIIQDGKLIGAVTHVFVNDPTKGFGIYIDWMLEQ
ncbi:MAG: SpoIVB peptidase [Clostridiales bacterium]|nr:SpoIVB peptidase [Clostridiales bacterium]